MNVHRFIIVGWLLGIIAGMSFGQFVETNVQRHLLFGLLEGVGSVYFIFFAPKK